MDRKQTDKQTVPIETPPSVCYPVNIDDRRGANNLGQLWLAYAELQGEFYML